MYALRAQIFYFYMIAHTSIPVSDYKKAKKFYTGVLATLGYTQNMEYGEAAGFNDGKNTDFWIGTNEKRRPRPSACRLHCQEQERSGEFLQRRRSPQAAKITARPDIARIIGRDIMLPSCMMPTATTSRRSSTTTTRSIRALQASNRHR